MTNTAKWWYISGLWVGVWLGVMIGFGLCAWLVEMQQLNALGLRVSYWMVVMPVCFFTGALPGALVTIARAVRRYRAASAGRAV